MTTLKTAPVAIIIAMAALTAGCDTMNSMRAKMRGTAPAVAESPRAQHAADYWKQNAKDGYMSLEATRRYQDADGRGMGLTSIDTDQDKRVSEQEWNAYHSNQ